ncbi:MAG TPA: S1C family serine protease [Actinomycetota bacterium]|nr:S1C family serine protease [Actinomycetota bacterium]
MGVLDEVQEAVAAVAASAGPSVVGIGSGGGRGSGIVLGEGTVLTNAHNLRGGEVTVVFPEGHSEVGTVKGVDIEGDLAVIAVGTGDAPALAWSEAAVGLGTPVFALANRSGRGLRVTQGFVSSVGRAFRGPRGRTIAGTVEHTAPMAHGSSGGPIVDATGKLLGINTNRAGEGFYQALPADEDLARRVAALGRGEAPYRPRLGLGIIPGRMARRLRQAVGLPERDGLLVREVEEGGAGAAAGLQQGDYIVAAAGKGLATVEDLQNAMEALAPGATLQLTVVRGAEERAVTLTLPDAG